MINEPVDIGVCECRPDGQCEHNGLLKQRVLDEWIYLEAARRVTGPDAEDFARVMSRSPGFRAAVNYVIQATIAMPSPIVINIGSSP